MIQPPIPNQGSRFSVYSLTEQAGTLSINQKKLLDEIWNRFISFNAPYPKRGITVIFGKQTIEEAFDGLNGSIIYEADESGEKCLKLTIHGAFLTENGPVLASLLVRLLDFVKSLYEDDPMIKVLDHKIIQAGMSLSDQEMILLLGVLRLCNLADMPIWLGGHSNDGTFWSINVNDKVMDLYQSNSTVTYLDQRLSADYDPNKPWPYETRLSYEFQRPNNSPPQKLWANLFDMSQQAPETMYISQHRLDELRAIKSSEFDCTRLICLCEELNACATRENAHAVIVLTRAILDHVPPVFGFRTFAEVASNYSGGGASFKKSTERLEKHSRLVADRLLHMPIRDKELVPSMAEVQFDAEIEGLLAEFCRLLK